MTVSVTRLFFPPSPPLSSAALPPLFLLPSLSLFFVSFLRLASTLVPLTRPPALITASLSSPLSSHLAFALLCHHPRFVHLQATPTPAYDSPHSHTRRHTSSAVLCMCVKVRVLAPKHVQQLRATTVSAFMHLR